jgi:hypothetical protein
MMVHAGLTLRLWTEAVSHAGWLRNRTTTAVTPGSTPHERATSEKPNLANLPIWGQKVWVKTKPQSKLEARAEEVHWVGFDESTKDGHCVYWPKKHIVTVERDVKFNFNDGTADMPAKGEYIPNSARNTSSEEPLAPAQPHVNTNATDVMPTENAPTQSNTSTSEPATMMPVNSTTSARIEEVPDEDAPPAETTMHSTHQRQPSAWLRDLRSGAGTTGGRGAARMPTSILEQTNAATTEVQGELDAEMPVFALAAMKGDTPTYRKAMKGPDKSIWTASMDDEIGELTKTGTLDELVLLPAGKNVVGCTWVLRKKHDADNKVVKHKSCLCAQGFLQKPGVDFHETAALTVRKSSLRYILSLVAEHDLETHQIDFKNAYLNGSLDKEIYMKQPPGFEVPGKEGHVWQLKKAIYGLTILSLGLDPIQAQLAQLGATRCN